MSLNYKDKHSSVYTSSYMGRRYHREVSPCLQSSRGPVTWIKMSLLALVFPGTKLRLKNQNTLSNGGTRL